MARWIFMAAVLALHVGGAFAQAQQNVGEVYPARPIRLVNSLSAGSAGDRLARQFADALSPRVNQKVLVDNRPGDGGNIAAVAVAKAPADGYLLLFSSTASLAIQMTYGNLGNSGGGTLPYDLRRDFAPISTVAQIPNGFFVTPVFTGDSLQALVKEAKAQPGKLTCASSGVGGLLHLTCELFKKAAAVEVLHVAYKGSTAFLPELVSGRITLAFDNVPVYVPLVNAGKLKILAVTSQKRASVLPYVPTTAELGMPQLESVGLFGLLAPARTPEAVVKMLSSASVAALQQPALRAQAQKEGVEPDGSVPDGLRRQIDNEINKWARVIKDANIGRE